MNVKEFSNLLIKNELATSEELQGCSEKEIEQLEEHIGAKLPQTYREFLTLMGHDAGIFWRGTDYLYKSVFNLTEYVRETMMDGSFKLPNDAFVFSSHQGYFLRISDCRMATILQYIVIWRKNLIPQNGQRVFRNV